MSLGHLDVDNGQRWTSSICQDLDDLSATDLPCSTFRVPEGVLEMHLLGDDAPEWDIWKIGLVSKFSFCLTIREHVWLDFRFPSIFIERSASRIKPVEDWNERMWPGEIGSRELANMSKIRKFSHIVSSWFLTSCSWAPGGPSKCLSLKRSMWIKKYVKMLQHVNYILRSLLYWSTIGQD